MYQLFVMTAINFLVTTHLGYTNAQQTNNVQRQTQYYYIVQCPYIH